MLSSFTSLWRLMVWVWALHHHGGEWIQLAGRDSKAELEAACATLGSGSLSREPQAVPGGSVISAVGLATGLGQACWTKSPLKRTAKQIGTDGSVLVTSPVSFSSWLLSTAIFRNNCFLGMQPCTHIPVLQAPLKRKEGREEKRNLPGSQQRHCNVTNLPPILCL